MGMKAIEVKDLSKTFKTKVKDKGLKGSIKSIFKPNYKAKKAVNKIDFSVPYFEINKSIVFFILSLVFSISSFVRLIFIFYSSSYPQSIQTQIPTLSRYFIFNPHFGQILLL